MLVLFRLFSHLPLNFLQTLGAGLGWLAYLASPSYRRQFQTAQMQAGYTQTQLRPAIAHAGQMIAELPRIWLGKVPPVQLRGQVYLDEAQSSGKPIAFMTMHLGGYEVAAQFLGQYFHERGQSLLALYRPSRLSWLEPVVRLGRNRGGLKTTPTTLSGVRQLLKAMKTGQSCFMVCDQVPPDGMGEWAPFFGRPAYTMSLAARLARQSHARVLLVLCKRLPHAQGFELKIEPFEGEFSEDAAIACTQMNTALEGLIRQCPEQYLWGYARYKKPRQAVELRT